MFQGTGSDVGKSLIVAGLARAFADRGLNVRPFKPQNMSNNAAVTADGGEIGRAQALQARAARTPPTVHMNPVLLKPQSEVGAQIVVQGRVHGTAKAAAYQGMKPDLMPFVLDSFARLEAEADIVLVEGAGSASEVNLRANDIANMGFARAADVPVVLIGDIDRGGVIASLVGTKAVIDAADAALVARLPRQQVSRRSGAVCRRHGRRSRARTGWAGARPGSVLLPMHACCRPRMRWRSTGRAGEASGASARSRCRSCRTSPISTISIRSTPSPRSSLCACGRARAARRCRSRHPAGLEGDHRRSRSAARRPASTSTSPRIGAAAAVCSGSAAATRCSGARSLILPASKGRRQGRRPRPARCRDRAFGRKAARAGARADRATAARSRAMRCTWA